MSDWSAGYVADVGYTFGYYGELNPLAARFALTAKGIKCGPVTTACELGFGQGLSANINAAASTTHWYGTDFNPAQAGFARDLAETSGASARLYDEAFADFAHRSDLPDFDFIGLHGIWSWVSDENRSVIVDFVRRKLKVGGVLYISYNTLPGWAAFAPIRHLMTEHAEVIGAAGRGIVSRIDDALEFADQLLATNPNFHRANPLVAERVKRLKDYNRHYLAHEYFNKDWHPMHFATAAAWLEPAKLQFACSAQFLDHIDAINLTADQNAFLSKIPDMMFRESTRDFMVNQQFRRDYWVKGARRLTILQQTEALREMAVALVDHPDDITLKVNGALGEANMSEPVYRPIIEALADHTPKSIQQLEEALKDHKITFQQLIQAIIVMLGAGHLCLAQDEASAVAARGTSDKLNQRLLDEARSSSDIFYLASPVSGGGVQVSRFQQLFLLGLRQGSKKTAKDLAAFAWQVISAQGQRLKKDGKLVEKTADNIAELESQANTFLKQRLPILNSLQVR